MLDRARHWRNMANACRTVAAHLVNPQARATFLQLARDYDLRATRSEELQPLPPKPTGAMKGESGGRRHRPPR